MSPIGPSPIITIELDFEIGAMRETLFRQHATGSKRAASSSVKLSGTGTRPPILIICSGIATYCAKPPFDVEPISLRLIQRLYLSRWQYGQSRHGISGHTATLEPPFILAPSTLISF